MTHVICRLTAKNLDQLRNPTLSNRVWATFLLELRNKTGAFSGSNPAPVLGASRCSWLWAGWCVSVHRGAEVVRRWSAGRACARGRTTPLLPRVLSNEEELRKRRSAHLPIHVNVSWVGLSHDIHMLPYLHFFLTYLLPYLSFPLRIDPLRFQIGCYKRWLNLALVLFVLFYVVLYFFWLVIACFCCVPRFRDNLGKPVPERSNQSGFKRGKRWWDGSGISWTICRQSAPRFRQITMPTPHQSISTCSS